MYDADPGMLAVRNIRHPATYLNTWMSHFVERYQNDHEEVYRKQHEEPDRPIA